MCAAVDKIEEWRKPEDFIGYRKPGDQSKRPNDSSQLNPYLSGCSAAGSAPALGAGCRGFESRHSDQKSGIRICEFRAFLLRCGIKSANTCERSRRLLWAKTPNAASGGVSEVFCVQRSIKSRNGVSPKILSGTANRRRSRGCRGFESRHSDQKSGIRICEFRAFLLRCGIKSANTCERSRRLLWAKTPNAASGGVSEVFCVQRSIKSRNGVSPKILSGTANRRRSRGCRGFESRHSDHISTMVLIRNHRAFSLLVDIYTAI